MANLSGDNNNNNISGTNNADTIRGLGGNDRLSGLDGNDRIFGGDGSDTLLGGGGNDYVYGDTTGSSIIVDFPIGQRVVAESRTLNFTPTSNDFLTNEPEASLSETVEFSEVFLLPDVLFLNTYNDSIVGGSGADTLLGEQGADTIHGGTGNDFVRGGTANDRIFGDSGG